MPCDTGWNISKIETQTSTICPAASEQKPLTQVNRHEDYELIKHDWKIAAQLGTEHCVLQEMMLTLGWILKSVFPLGSPLVNRQRKMGTYVCLQRASCKAWAWQQRFCTKHHHWWWELVPQLQPKIKIPSREWHHVTSEKAWTNALGW